MLTTETICKISYFVETIRNETIHTSLGMGMSKELHFSFLGELYIWANFAQERKRSLELQPHNIYSMVNRNM